MYRNIKSSQDTYNASNNSSASLTSVIPPDTPLISSSSSFNSRAVDVSMPLSSKLRLAYYIAIALTGLIGNTTTIIVFSQRRLRSLRSSFFLTCLAITDLIFILILVVALLDELHAPVMTTPVCMLTIYLSHIASFLSSNFTLAYTSHRLIAVFFPIKATTFLKQRTNRVLAFALLVFSCSFYSLSFPIIVTTLRSNATKTVDCREDEKKQLSFPFFILDTLFTFIFPFSLITCMNLAIVYKLHTKFTYKQKLPVVNPISATVSPSGRSSTNSSVPSATEAFPLSQLTHANGNNNNSNILSNKDSQQHSQKQDHSFLSVHPIGRHKKLRVNRAASSPSSPRRRPLYHRNTSIRIRSTQSRATASAKTTKMLLAASTVFLVFNLPYHLLLFCFLIISKPPSWMLEAVNIARLWFFASFCVNFFVYAICGKRFRNEVVRLFSCLFLRGYYKLRNQGKSQDRQNSIYFSHRLLPISSTRLSQQS